MPAFRNMPPRRFATLLLLLCSILVFALALAGCGGGNSGGGGGTPTATISASPTTIPAGMATTLTWATTNATSISIDNGVGSVSASGTKQVSPAVTTTYTITAKGNGQTATANVTVAVTAPGAGPMVTMTANPATINSGQSSTLAVTATGAAKVIITNNKDQTSFTLPGSGGTQVVMPIVTTIYTATATGPGGQTATATAAVTVSQGSGPSVSITANPPSITSGQSSTLSIAATNSTSVAVTNSNDSGTLTLPGNGGSAVVYPTKSITYTATATGTNHTTATAMVSISVAAAATPAQINHVVFLMQENRSFDTYFGALNPYRKSHGFNRGDDGNEYDLDGFADVNGNLKPYTNVNDEGAVFGLFKFTTSCIDDLTSAWLESYGDVSRFDFTPARRILMDGFVHTAEGFEKSGAGTGEHTNDLVGQRAMGYYDQGLLNYYAFMASQFSVSDRWFSPVSSKSTPNRIATYSGGTTQGLVRDPFRDDMFTLTLTLETIFEKLDRESPATTWKIYYSITQDLCGADGDECNPNNPNKFPVTSFSDFAYSFKYLFKPMTPGACTGTTQPSGLPPVNDPDNAFCIDIHHIVPISQYFTDLNNGTLPNFAYIEAKYGQGDEHPGSGQSILKGQLFSASLINALMNSSSWGSSVFFFSFDEGGGPFDHVPPVPGHTNDNSDAGLGITTDISSIAVNADGFKPCVPPPSPPPPPPPNPPPPPSPNCDLKPVDPGANPADAPAIQGFAAQLGFRVPNIVISPFARKHYVSHRPMDHTAIIKFVENRFIGPSAHLTARDAAQPDLMDFFDFNGVPWSNPPSPPTPVAESGQCHPMSMGP